MNLKSAPVHTSLLSDSCCLWQAEPEQARSRGYAGSCVPCFDYGPGGALSGAFGDWARSHEHWMGRPHLESYWRLTGGQAGRQVHPCIMMCAEHLLAKMGSCCVTRAVCCLDAPPQQAQQSLSSGSSVTEGVCRGGAGEGLNVSNSVVGSALPTASPAGMARQVAALPGIGQQVNTRPHYLLSSCRVSRPDAAGGSLHRPHGHTATSIILLDTLLQALRVWCSWWPP